MSLNIGWLVLIIMSYWVFEVKELVYN